MAQIQMETYYYTPEEYLTLEDKAAYKSEYINGDIFAMAGGTLKHDKIAGNIYRLLGNALEDKECDVYSSDVKVLINPNGAFVYPDVSVLCGKPEYFKNRRDIISNPMVIVEVLSKSTREYDRTGKFELYRNIKTLQDYLLVAQDQIQVHHYHRLADNRWVLTIFAYLESVIRLESIAVDLPLSDIYRKINWEELE